ncbi:MAG: disulfide bond formation protein DsbA [Desulfobacterales bacterium]|nr:MAG: disulfide bond formation protein DsbA [Desulfobacterales bacterium]
MLKSLTLCALLLTPGLALAAASDDLNSSGDLNWSTQQFWKMDAQPRAFVQSLDNKKTFVLGADSKVHIYSINGKELGAMPVSPDVIAIDIAPRGETLYLLNAKENSFTALDISFTQHINITNNPVLGNPAAPVTLVEFSDFECPFCSKVKPVIDTLLEHNKDTLKVVFKHMPLRMHPMAESAALAAIAAQKQGKFWEMHDALFQANKLTAATIDQMAQTIGLDMEQFKQDKNTTVTKQQLAEDMRDAQRAEVTGTPTLFINGMRVKNRSPEAMQKMIDKALAKVKN